MTIKGVITHCKYEQKYEADGIAYKDYVLIVENKKYTAQVKEAIYLQEGMTVALALKPNTLNEVVAGYCIKEDYTWGKNAGDLKRETPASEKYSFVQGVIVEKRKSTTGSIYMNRSALSNRGTRISYTIVLPTAEFHASADEGTYLQAGMDIAAVLEKNESVIILDKAANKYLGLSKPYFILFIVALLCFNGYMYHLYQTNQTHLLRFRPTLIVVNIFLVLATALSIATYKVTSSAKAFLLANMGE